MTETDRKLLTVQCTYIKSIPTKVKRWHLKGEWNSGRSCWDHCGVRCCECLGVSFHRWEKRYFSSELDGKSFRHDFQCTWGIFLLSWLEQGVKWKELKHCFCFYYEVYVGASLSGKQWTYFNQNSEAKSFLCDVKWNTLQGLWARSLQISLHHSLYGWRLFQ